MALIHVKFDLDIGRLRDVVGQQGEVTEVHCLVLILAPLTPTSHELGVAVQTGGGAGRYGLRVTLLRTGP